MNTSLKNVLKNTWSAFFGRFGQLTPIQEATIPPVLEGKNVMVCAPTATGKTEAVIAPLIERLIPHRGEKLLLLYIAPTRALLNNLLVRLDLGLKKCGFKAIVRTGDRPYLPKNPFQVLFTTPESLDSLLCRQKQIWKHIQAILIDEIHFLDNTYRGDQLRILLRRLLQEHLEITPQFAALSATLYNPEEVGKRYFSPVQVIQSGQPRPLAFYLLNDWTKVITLLREKKWHKVIVFCNRRRDVEELYSQLSQYWPKERLIMHHGSLSRRLREEAELLLRQWRWGICVCTSTLEIGIDIGDFDVAICYHPPPTPSAFQQRVGRASRQKGYQVAIGFYEKEADIECFNLYASLAHQGIVEAIHYSPDLSVVVQQIFSMLFAHPEGLRLDQLFYFLSPLVSEEILEKIVIHLCEKNWIEPQGRVFKASEKLMNIGERGLIHSNIPNTREFKVVESRTQKSIGEITTQAAIGHRFILAGKVWEVTKVKGKTLFVRLVAAKPTLKVFHKRFARGAFTHLLPPELVEPH